MRPFPIYRLNEAVTSAMSKIVTIDIGNGIANGLNQQINFVDEHGGSISTIAEISNYTEPLNKESQKRVKISATYAQILWMICNIALRNHDTIAIESEIDRMSLEERKQYFKDLQQDSEITKYQRELLDRKKSFELSSQMLNFMEQLAQRNITEEEMDYLYSFDMDSDLGVKVNSIYVYAMTFILLHEFSHHALNHDVEKEGTIQEEIAADCNAFWSIYSDLNGADKTTAMIGILCSLVSLIFIDKSLSADGVHPLPIERIFRYYDLVKEDNPKYAGLLCHLFYAWAVYTHDEYMPKLEAPYNGTLEKIREYMFKKEFQANNPE